ncbi:MAG: ribulose-phosphate 3-epimerase [Patescibacteria group bacterium]
MTEIIPSLIGKSFEEIAIKINRVEGMVDWVHFDVADGKFATPESWGNPEDLATLNGKTKIEAHLMIEAPEEVLPQWLAVADRVIVHYEATENLAEILDIIDLRVNEAGVALLMSTNLDVLVPHIDKIDLVQLMTIEKIGEYGQPFSPQALARISALRQKFPNVKISVDGGINLETGKQAIEAGADNLVVGSAIWNAPDLAKVIEEFKKL